MKADETRRLEAAVRGANPVPHALDLVGGEEGAAVTLLVEEGRRQVTATAARPATQTVPASRRRRKMSWVFAVGVVVTLLLGGAALLLAPGDGAPVADESATAPTAEDGIRDEPLTLEGRVGPSSVVAWSPDGTHLATSIDGTANIWDATTGEPLAHQHIDHLGEVSTLVWSPDGTRIAVDSAIYDPFTGDLVLGEIGDRVLAYSPDGSRIVAGGAWGWAAIVDAATGDEALVLPSCPSWVWAASWSPDGNRLATTCGMEVRVWDAATGAEVLTITSRLTPIEAGGRVTDVAWSPDGARIATVGRDTLGSSGVWLAEIWDAATGDELVSLTGHTAAVWAIAWSPDGARIATASEDETARIWDADSGEELATLSGHTAPVTDVAWSPDGTRIVTASRDGTAKIWSVG